MEISLTKHPQSPVITCTRDDGSFTWQKSAHGPFFGPHDLLHYAVESTLGLRESFFGLIAAGRSIEWFAEPGIAARLPLEALHTEMIVNQLMIEMNHEALSRAAEFNTTLIESWAASKHGGKTPPYLMTDVQLDQVRQRYAELRVAWDALRDGEKLELDFPDT